MSIISSAAGATRSRWGAPGTSIFILSRQNTDPQPELRATSPFPAGDSSSFSLVISYGGLEGEKSVFSCQPPEDTQELGTRKTVFPFYPAKEPRDI